jgi:hypothetical protein
VHPRIEAILAEQGVVTVAEYPRLESSLRRLTRERVLDNPLPGVFAPSGDQSSPLAWLRAVTAWSAPDGVLHGRSAASLWLPELAGPVAFVAHPTLRARGRVVVSRHLVPPEFVRATAGLRVASPAYAAVELAGVDDGRALCDALRLRLHVLRFGWEHLDQPEYVAAMVRRAFLAAPPAR